MTNNKNSRNGGDLDGNRNLSFKVETHTRRAMSRFTFLCQGRTVSSDGHVLTRHLIDPVTRVDRGDTRYTQAGASVA